MNLFFHASNEYYTSHLVIPKFTNDGSYSGLRDLYSARVNKSKWDVTPEKCKQDSNWWFVEGTEANKNDIYFIAASEEVASISHFNILSDLNNFTDTSPEFRANLKVSSKGGAFSSFQSEYPFRMTKAKGDCYSDCGSLTNRLAIRNYVFLRNISSEPDCRKHECHLYDNASGQVLNKFNVFSNQTNCIDLAKWNENLGSCFIHIEGMLAVPIYLCEYPDGSLSVEHSQPPHEFVHGPDRFDLVRKLKRAAYEKIYS